MAILLYKPEKAKRPATILGFARLHPRVLLPLPNRADPVQKVSTHRETAPFLGMARTFTREGGTRDDRERERARDERDDDDICSIN